MSQQGFSEAIINGYCKSKSKSVSFSRDMVLVGHCNDT